MPFWDRITGGGGKDKQPPKSADKPTDVNVTVDAVSGFSASAAKVIAALKLDTSDPKIIELLSLGDQFEREHPAYMGSLTGVEGALFCSKTFRMRYLTEEEKAKKASKAEKVKAPETGIPSGTTTPAMGEFVLEGATASDLDHTVVRPKETANLGQTVVRKPATDDLGQTIVKPQPAPLDERTVTSPKLADNGNDDRTIASPAPASDLGATVTRHPNPAIVVDDPDRTQICDVRALTERVRKQMAEEETRKRKA